MNRRIQQFLSAENLSQAQFADTIGVARASVSHIVSGRNNPGYEFIHNMAAHYPSLNLEWLITGQGKMYKNSTENYPEPPSYTTESLFKDSDTKEETPLPEPEPAKLHLSNINTSSNRVKSIDNKRNVSKIILFYSDGTFQEFK